MVWKLSNDADKLPIDVINVVSEKKEGLPTHSKLFSLILLAPELPFPDYQPLTVNFDSTF